MDGRELHEYIRLAREHAAFDAPVLRARLVGNRLELHLLGGKVLTFALSELQPAGATGLVATKKQAPHEAGQAPHDAGQAPHEAGQAPHKARYAPKPKPEPIPRGRQKRRSRRSADGGGRPAEKER